MSYSLAGILGRNRVKWCCVKLTSGTYVSDSSIFMDRKTTTLFPAMIPCPAPPVFPAWQISLPSPPPAGGRAELRAGSAGRSQAPRSRPGRRLQLPGHDLPGPQRTSSLHILSSSLSEGCEISDKWGQTEGFPHCRNPALLCTQMSCFWGSVLGSHSRQPSHVYWGQLLLWPLLPPL